MANHYISINNEDDDGMAPLFDWMVFYDNYDDRNNKGCCPW